MSSKTRIPPVTLAVEHPIRLAPTGLDIMRGEPFDIRSFGPADLESVMAIERESYAHPWSGELFLQEARNPCSSLDLAWWKGDLAGYLCSWLVAGELHILNLATAVSFRRRGVAAALLRHAIERASSFGLTRAFLEVRVGNEAAIHLYRQFGFRMAYRRPRYYPDGEDAFVMEWRRPETDSAPAPLPGERKDV